MKKLKKCLLATTVLGLSPLVYFIENKTNSKEKITEQAALVKAHNHDFPFADLVHKYSIDRNLPEAFLRAIISKESLFNPHAERYEPHINDTSYGLMQILSKKACELKDKFSDLPSLDINRNGILEKQETRRALLDPEINIAYGSKYLEDSFSLYEDLALTAASYNSGQFRPRNMALQYQLNRILNEDIKLDGIIGRASKSIIKKFQRMQRLKADGVLTKETREIISQEFYERFPNEEKVTGFIPQNKTTPIYVDELMALYNSYKN